GRTYSPAALAFFKEFCDHLGVLLENARLYDEITRRDRAKDMFLASLSHELRNPLAPIRSSLELMRLRGIPQDLSEDVATVEHQFGHMTRLLGDLLDVTRYTQEKIILSTVLLDPKIIIERVMTAAAPIARAGGVVLEQSFPPEQLFIEADPVRLEQAITNLVTNAIKFTPSGGKVRAALAKDDTDALITVADTGTGIEKVDLPNIFDMYYQGNREKGRLSSGLGIGLYLVQKIVDLHGGRIEALSSGSGKGSTFIIRIPLSEKRPGGEKKKNGVTHARGLRVLVVDDNVAAADSLVRLLNLIGAQAEAAYSGRDVISRTDIDSFDSIVMDIGMPGLSGYELTNMLRKMGYAKQIVALTGYGLKEDREKALREGFSAHLTKPVGIAELRAVFETLS
ncbi:MAG: hybrid sensor histidine kinase/response regulator, partial [Patescibacteria group bacterium]|nr:hybrid sensor histidine kinase/response regulator [Patescibacteria group bacterium]